MIAIKIRFTGDDALEAREAFWDWWDVLAICRESIRISDTFLGVLAIQGIRATIKTEGNTITVVT